MTTSEELRGGTVFGGTLLVAGTCIGAGMLALPVLTSEGGFLPALLLYLFSWILMCCTGLLFLEICLWMGKHANIVSMSGHILGTGGKIFAWVLYLYLFYSLTVAYVAGGGQVVAEVLAGPKWLSYLLFVLVFGVVVYVGPWAVDRVNVVLIVGLGVSYALFLAMSAHKVRSDLLSHINWRASFYALPVIFTSFGFQGMVPTLTAYMNKQVHKIRLAIILGSAISLVAYVVWQLLIMGVIPSELLLEARVRGHTAIQPLRDVVGAHWIYLVGEFFAFFALTSSFLGVTLALRDFLADGLRIHRTPFGRLLLCAIIFVPAFFLSISDPRLFLLALRFGGGLGVALLLGLLPVLLAWVGRYRLKLEGPYRLFGGKPLLLFLGLLVVLELITELVHFG